MAELPLLPAALPAGTTGVFTTRAGGISRGELAELNLGRHGGDDPARVAANRARLGRRLGVPGVTFAVQVHGAEVRTVTALSIPAGAECDALVTDRPGIAVGVLVADCLPVLLADPLGGVVAAAHAGRRGLLAGVLQRTLERMAALGADPRRTTAVIGPGIGGCCYEVPAALRGEVSVALPEAASTTSWGTPSLDLAAAAAAILGAAGVDRVERVAACTYEDERFYSFRRAPGTGRFAGVVLRR